MKIRLHRGGLIESLQTLEEIEPTIEAIKQYFQRRQVLGWNSASKVEVQCYSSHPDKRIGWDRTYLVLIDGSPAAMTDRTAF